MQASILSCPALSSLSLVSPLFHISPQPLAHTISSSSCLFACSLFPLPSTAPFTHPKLQPSPGANKIEDRDGKVVNLEKLSPQERAAKAKLLLNQPGNRVYRHLINGDVLLVNRQPTLHKPGTPHCRHSTYARSICFCLSSRHSPSSLSHHFPGVPPHR